MNVVVNAGHCIGRAAVIELVPGAGLEPATTGISIRRVCQLRHPGFFDTRTRTTLRMRDVDKMVPRVGLEPTTTGF